MPKVSVILTSFNHAKFLRDSIDSVLSQTFKEFELIIWDDASTDESWSIISGYKDSRILAFRNETQTGSEMWGMNRAIAEVAQAEFIAIHHSDDVWKPEKLAKQVAYLDSNPDIGAVFSHVQIINEEGANLTKEDHPYYKVFDQPNRTRHEWLRFFFSSGNGLCHPSVLIRKSCHKECGLYRDCFFQTDDLEMWVRVCLKYDIHVLPERLIKFRVRDNEANVSGNRPEARVRFLYEFYKLLQHYRKLATFDDLVSVFPSAEKYDRNEESDVEFALAMVALEEKPFPFTSLFGLDLLFDAMSDPKRAANIMRLYDFGCKNFIALTGQHDVFSREELAKLWSVADERYKLIIDRDREIAERNRQISALHNSASWRITKPLRFFERQFRKILSRSVT